MTETYTKVYLRGRCLSDGRWANIGEFASVDAATEWVRANGNEFTYIEIMGDSPYEVERVWINSLRRSVDPEDEDHSWKYVRYAPTPEPKYTFEQDGNWVYVYADGEYVNSYTCRKNGYVYNADHQQVCTNFSWCGATLMASESTLLEVVKRNWYGRGR